jgi:hypothetical protein
VILRYDDLRNPPKIIYRVPVETESDSLSWLEIDDKKENLYFSLYQSSQPCITRLNLATGKATTASKFGAPNKAQWFDSSHLLARGGSGNRIDLGCINISDGTGENLRLSEGQIDDFHLSPSRKLLLVRPRFSENHDAHVYNAKTLKLEKTVDVNGGIYCMVSDSEVLYDESVSGESISGGVWKGLFIIDLESKKVRKLTDDFRTCMTEAAVSFVNVSLDKILTH